MTDAAIAAASDVAAPAPASEAAPATTADITPLGDRPISTESTQEAPKPVKVEVVTPKPKTAMDSLKEAQAKSDRNEKDRIAREAAKEAPKTDAKLDDKGKPIVDAKTTDKPVTDAPKAKIDPPARWTATAKAKWEALDDEVKAETDRTVKELEKGMNTYKAKVDDLKEFEEIATKAGTTVKTAMSNYVAIDKDLTSGDPARQLKALDHLFAVSKIDKGAFAKFVLDQAGRPADQQQVNPEIAALRQQVAQLTQQVQGTSQTIEGQQRAAVENHIANWSKDKPLADTLAPQIAQHVHSGLSLDDAYAKAVSEQQELARQMGFIPQPAAPAPSTATPQPQTLKGGKSITGSPGIGSYQATQKPSSSNVEAVRKAMEAAGISL